MNIIILGAGAIGSVYGAKLSRLHRVTLVGGAAHVDAIERDGLVMEGHTTGTFRLPASTTIESIEPGSLILLTAKVNNNAAAIRPIVEKLPEAVTIVCVQNGLYSEDIVKDLVGDRALVLRAITQVGGVLVRPGVVDNTVAGYTLLESHPQSPMIAETTDRGRPRRPHHHRHQERDVAQGRLQLRDQPDDVIAWVRSWRHRRPRAERVEAADHRRMPCGREGRRRRLRRGFHRPDRQGLFRRQDHRLDAAGPDEGQERRKSIT